MAATELRAKEATAQVTVDGVRQGGSFLTIHDINVKPDVDIAKKRFTGMKRAQGDLDVKGFGFTFKTEKRDHRWWEVWKKFEAAEENGDPFPVVTLAITHSYRDGSGQLRTVTLHGDLVMYPDSDDIPQDNYLKTSWTGFASYAAGL